jgi:hypothetical protein
MEPINQEFDELDMEEKLLRFRSQKIFRDPVAEAENRTRFMNKIDSLPVTNLQKQRLTIHNRNLFPFGFGKENFKMTPIILSITMALALFLGGGSLTVAAAQDSLPTDTLYPVKILSEDVREFITTQPEAKLNLLMDLANERLEEIDMTLQNGSLPGDEVMTRLQTHLSSAFQLASQNADMNDGEMLRLQARLKEQIAVFNQVGMNEDPMAQGFVKNTKQIIQNQIQMVDESLASPGSGPGSNFIDNEPTPPQNQQSQPEPAQNQNLFQEQQQNLIQNQEQNLIQNQEQNMLQNQEQNQIQEYNQNQNRELNGTGNNGSGTKLQPTPLPGAVKGQGSGNSGNSGGNR